MLLFVVFSTLLTVNCYGQSITWERVYNGPGNQPDGARSICKAEGGNFYVVGYTFLTFSLSTRSIYVLKLNPFGDTIWTRIFSDESRGPTGEAICSSSDGGCVITGYWGNAFTMKLDSSGSLIWLKFYGGSPVFLYDIVQTSDGGYFACGRYDNVNFSGHVLKIDSNGELEWQKTYPAQFSKYFTSLEIAGDGYLLTGTISNFKQEKGRAFVTKINFNGDTLWNRYYTIDTLTSGEKIIRSGNGYVIGGNVRWISNLDYTRMYLLRISENGDSVFAKILGGPTQEYFADIIKTNDNKYILTGSLDSANKLFGKIRITDSSGNTLHEKKLLTPDYIAPYAILEMQNGDYVITGEADMGVNPIFNDLYAIRIDSALEYTPIGISIISNFIPEKFELSQNFPNPFNPATSIKFSIVKPDQTKMVITDIMGRVIETPIDKYLIAGTYNFKWDAANFASGVYFYSLYSNNCNITKKMLLIK